MDTKMKHRILGLVVIASLVIIALPFFQNRPPQADIVIKQAPAFPKETVQVSEVKTPQMDEQNASIMVASHQPQAAQIQNTAMTTNDAPIKTQPDETIPANHVPEKNNPPVSLAQPIVSMQQTALAKQVIRPKNKIVAHQHKKAIASKMTLARTKKNTVMNNALNNNGLFQLKDKSWVIQIGSFKNHQRAIRLANQLRNKGYQAFIQQYSTTEGTHLFVGPLNQESQAYTLAKEIENNMHLHGYVVRYEGFV